MLLAQSSPVGARAMSFRVASMAGDDRDSTISVAIHGSSRFRPVRSIPISEKVGGATPPVLPGGGQFESPGSHAVEKQSGPLQGGGLGSFCFGAIVQSLSPFTRPHRSSP